MANTKIPSELIADSSITAAKLADGTITTADIADSNVTTAKIADSNVTTAKIGDAQVTTAKITDANVTTGKIADDAVTTAKMASNSVTSDTIASGITLAGNTTFGGNITQGSGDYIYNGGGNFDIKHTTASQNIVFSTTPSGGSATEVLRITHDGKLSKLSGDLTLDVAGDIILDADGDNIFYKAGGSSFYSISNVSGNTYLGIEQADKDLFIRGNDSNNGGVFTALSFDMSDRGKATFYSGITAGASTAGDWGLTLNTEAGDNMKLRVQDTGSSGGAHGTLSVSDGNLILDAAADIKLDADSSNIYLADGGTDIGLLSTNNQDLNIRNLITDKDIYFQGKDGSSTFTAFTLDMSEAGAATFNAGATLGGDLSMGSNQIIFNNNSQAILIKDAAGTASYVLYQDNADTLVVGNGTNVEKIRLDTSGNEGALVVDTNGSVGIGTSTPQHELVVASTGNTTLGLVGSGYDDAIAIRFGGGDLSSALGNGNSGAAIISQQAVASGQAKGDLRFQINTGDQLDTAMFISNAGNVGIGTSNPAQTLHVSSTGATSNGIRISNSEGSFETRVDQGEFYLYDVDDNRIPFLIDTSGNVGIGTTAPHGKLHLVETASGAAGVDFPLTISSDRYQADYGVGIAFRPENQSTGYKVKTALLASGGGYGYNQADLHFCLNQSNTVTDEVSLSDSRMTIKKSGNVGIGTTAPAVELDVIGYVKTSGIRFGATDKWKIRANSANAEIVFEYADSSTISDSNVKAKFHGNNFGIGTSMTSNTPEAKIHIKDGDSGSSYGTDGADKLIIEDNDSVAIDLRTPSANQGLIMFSDGTRGVGSIGYAHTNDQLNFKTGGAARFEIDSNGKLHAIYGFSRGAPFPHYYHKRSAQLQAGSSSKKKARIGRLYWTGGHWSAGGISLLARVGSEYYSGENRVYHFSAQYTDSQVSYQLLESHSKHSNNTRIYLGAVTTAHTYSGQPCRYQDIWVEANSYKRIHVDFTSLGKSSSQQINSSDITSGWGGIVVYDSLQDAADISDFTDELINKDADHFIATSDKVNDTLNQNEYFGFNQIQSGTSLNYNTSTYKYKVPITGVYLFGANVYRNSSSGGNISFRKTDSAGNNADVFGRQPQTHPAGDTVIHLGQMKYCTKGDLVGVFNYGGSFSNFYGASDDNYSSFYGHLIKSTM